MTRLPRIEVLFWAGCPSYPRALEELRMALTEAGLDPNAVELREVIGDEQAERERFPGSPTIRIDGVDVVDVEGQPPSLGCRVYQRRDGRFSPTPDPQDLRDALGRERRSDTLSG